MEYRLYFLDDLGHIRRAIDIDCEDENAAILAAQQYRDGQAMELWRRDNVVATFARTEPSGAG